LSFGLHTLQDAFGAGRLEPRVRYAPGNEDSAHPLIGISKNYRNGRRDVFYPVSAYKRRKLPEWPSRFLQVEDGYNSAARL